MGTANYNVTPEFSVGVELAHERGFDGPILGGAPYWADSATFFGPAIQYVGHPLHVALGFQAQLPWAEGDTALLHNGYLADAERVRVRFRVGMDL